MIFEHRDSGIRVVVNEERQSAEYKYRDGTCGSVAVLVRLETDAGQPCVMACGDDTTGPIEIDVATSHGYVRMTRVS